MENGLAAASILEPMFGCRSDLRPAVVARHILTGRETAVLRLLADGLTTKTVAARLGIAFSTAAQHRARILQKLRVESTVLAVRWAIRYGIVDL
jgi:DNA-binding CsgD family transcriptional regulator